MKKRIAYFQEDLNYGGIQKSLVNLLNNLDYNKYEIDLYLFSDENIYLNLLNKNVNVIKMPKNSFFIKNIPFFVSKIFQKKFKTTKEYDYAIDYNSYQNCTSLAAIYSNAKNKVIYIHNNILEENKALLKYRFRAFFLKSKYKYYNKFIGVSKGVIEPFKKYSKQYQKQYFVIPNFVDSEEIIKRSQEPINLNIDKNKYNLVTVSRIVHQKGHDIMIKLLKDVIKKRKDVHLYIIGDGDKKQFIEKLVNKYNLNEYVTFLGSLPNPFPYLKIMDGFLFTSRYEGQGIVLQEALCLGLELFFPKHLEIYQADLMGSKNLIKDLISASKKDKKINNLKNYNENIMHSINDFFEVNK